MITDAEFEELKTRVAELEGQSANHSRDLSELRQFRGDFDELVDQRLNPAVTELQNQIDQLTAALSDAKSAMNALISQMRTDLTDKIGESAQTTAIATQQALNSLENNIKSGGIIAKKAEMLRARNDQHWIKWHKTEADNHDLFELFRSTDGQWFPLIRVSASQASDSANMLRARNGNHWMKWHTTEADNHDLFELFRSTDGQWFPHIKVNVSTRTE